MNGAARQRDFLHNLDVCIVGGSLAACATATLLLRAGCRVTVFERSHGNLEDRGVGMAISIVTLKALTRRDLIDTDMAILPVWRRNFVRRPSGDDADDYLGHVFWEHPVAFHANHWGVLFRSLRKRVPDDIYHQGSEVTAISEQPDGSIEVQLADGATRAFDLVICADGYESIGRRVLYPDTDIRPARYFLWRGMIEEANVPQPEVFDETITFVAYRYGHGLIYWVPSPETGAAVGNRRLNWGFHETIAGKDIPGVEPDEHGYVRKGLAPGAATAEQVAYCQDMARRHFPAYIADIVELTPQPFIQPVIDVFVPRYTRGRICLMGDAATLARPHIGGGAGKALDDALALADALAAHDSLDDALAAWDVVRTAVGNEVVSLGQSFGRYLVEEHPDWDAMDQDSMDRRWRKLMEGRYWYMVDEVKDWHPILGRRA